jgi:hypothetical protein
MSKMNPARTVKAAAALGLALAMGANASVICSNSGYPGAKCDFVYAAPVVDKSYPAADTYLKLVNDWLKTYGGGNSGLQSLIASLLGGLKGYVDAPSCEPVYVPKVPETPAVPEPTTAVLVAGGLLGVAALARRKKA